MKSKTQEQVLEIEQKAHAQAAILVRLIFLRVGCDSPAGQALRRAMGFSGDSLKGAAGKLGISPAALKRLQRELEEQLGPLAFLAKSENRKAA